MESARLGGASLALPRLSRLRDVRAQVGRLDSRAPLAATVASSAALAAASALAAFGTDEPAGQTALDVLLIGTPLLVGLYAMRTARTAPFGRLLVAASLVWSVTVLADAERSLPYSAGRVAAWCLIPIVIFLILSFPEGRLASARDARLFRWVVGVVAILYIGSVPFIETFPEHSPWVTCTADCPPNAFFVLSSEPGFVGAVLEPLRELLGAAVLVAMCLSLLTRARASSGVGKASGAPVLVVGTAVTGLLAGFLVVRTAAPDAHAADVMGVVWSLCLPAIAAAFCFGILRRRLLAGNVLFGLGLALDVSFGPRQLGAILRSSLGGSEVELLSPDPRSPGWLHDDGRPVEPGFPGPDLVVREIRDAGTPVAAIVLDAELDTDDELIEAIVSLTEAALREARLEKQLAVSRADLDALRRRNLETGEELVEAIASLTDARKRIATAADVERRRIERDLHDGAQQRLIALRMRLSLVEELVRQNAAAAEAIRHLELDVDRALEEIRSLAQGIYPALLADRGLKDALESVARRSPLRVEVCTGELTRQSPEVETAVYFSCLEAVQNAIKHGHGATGAQISLRQGDVLSFEVSDDGAGFDPATAPRGAGVASMHDRVESLGGTLSVESAPGRGTVVRGSVPIADAQRG